jgi:hypothetical protein
MEQEETKISKKEPIKEDNYKGKVAMGAATVVINEAGI